MLFLPSAGLEVELDGEDSCCCASATSRRCTEAAASTAQGSLARPVPLGGHEAQPHRSLVVLAVRVDEHDRLPGAERDPPVDHRHASATATTNDGQRGGRRRARRCRDDARSDRPAGGRGRAASSRSCSEPLPVSISATPAVACGHEHVQEPVAADLADEATDALGQVDLRDRACRAVNVSERIGSPADVANVGSAEHLGVLDRSSNDVEPELPGHRGARYSGPHPRRPVGGSDVYRVPNPFAYDVENSGARRKLSTKPCRIDRLVLEELHDRLLALDRARGPRLLRPLDDPLMVRRRRERPGRSAHDRATGRP